MEYRAPYLRIKEYIFNQRKFITNNLLAAAEMLGLIPTKLVHEFNKEISAPKIQFLIDEHGLLGDMYEADQFLDSLICKLKNEEGYYCTKRTEQSECYLVQRVSSLSDTKYFSHYFQAQELFHVEGNIVCMIHSNE